MRHAFCLNASLPNHEILIRALLHEKRKRMEDLLIDLCVAQDVYGPYKDGATRLLNKPAISRDPGNVRGCKRAVPMNAVTL